MKETWGFYYQCHWWEHTWTKEEERKEEEEGEEEKKKDFGVYKTYFDCISE